MGAYEGLSKYFANGVLHKANELGYGEFLISILKGDEETLEQKYNSVWSTLKECKYQMEGRDPIEFGRDIIASWIFEDCVVGALKSSGLNISFGKDYFTRKRFTPRIDKLDTDIIIDTGNNKYTLEIRCDHTLSWTRTNTLYLTESKYKKMKKDNAIMLGFSTVDGKITILNNSCLKNATYIEEYEQFGGRPVYAISIPESSICEFNKTNVVKEIKNYCLYK